MAKETSRAAGKQRWPVSVCGEKVWEVWVPSNREYHIHRVPPARPGHTWARHLQMRSPNLLRGEQGPFICYAITF